MQQLDDTAEIEAVDTDAVALPHGHSRLFPVPSRLARATIPIGAGGATAPPTSCARSTPRHGPLPAQPTATTHAAPLRPGVPLALPPTLPPSPLPPLTRRPSAGHPPRRVGLCRPNPPSDHARAPRRRHHDPTDHRTAAALQAHSGGDPTPRVRASPQRRQSPPPTALLPPSPAAAAAASRVTDCAARATTLPFPAGCRARAPA